MSTRKTYILYDLKHNSADPIIGYGIEDLAKKLDCGITTAWRRLHSSRYATVIIKNSHKNK